MKINIFNKQNKKRMIIICVCIFLLLSIITCILLFSSGFSKEQKLEEQLQDILDSAETDEDGTQVAEQIYSKTSFNIHDVTDSDCMITVTAPNIRELFFSIFNYADYSQATNFTEYEDTINKILGQLEKKLIEDKCQYITTDTKVPLDENGDLEITYELADALYGGLLTLQQELINNYIQEGSNE